MMKTSIRHFKNLFVNGKGLFAFASVFILSIGTAHAGYAVKNLDLNDSGGSSYVRDLTVSASGSDMFVQAFVSPTSPSARPHRVTVSGLPSGLTPVSYSTADSDCASISVSQYVSGFAYDFPGNCDGAVTARYRTHGVGMGSHSFSATVTDFGPDNILGTADDVSTSTNTVSVTVSSKAVLLRARTLDLNGDGYLDAYSFFYNLVPASPLSPA